MSVVIYEEKYTDRATRPDTRYLTHGILSPDTREVAHGHQF